MKTSKKDYKRKKGQKKKEIKKMLTSDKMKKEYR